VGYSLICVKVGVVMANDLKSTLLIDSIQDTAWWGRYDFLDDYSAPPATAAILRQA